MITDHLTGVCSAHQRGKYISNIESNIYICYHVCVYIWGYIFISIVIHYCSKFPLQHVRLEEWAPVRLIYDFYFYFNHFHFVRPGPWFNIKIPSCQYRKSRCGDKTILRPSYLHNGISYTGKMTSLYWIGAHNLIGDLPLPGSTQHIITFHDILFLKQLQRNHICPQWWRQ